MLFFPFRCSSEREAGRSPGRAPQNRAGSAKPAPGCGRLGALQDEGCGTRDANEGCAWRTQRDAGRETGCELRDAACGTGGTDRRTPQWFSGGTWKSAPWHCLRLWCLLSLVNLHWFLEAGWLNVTRCRIAAGAAALGKFKILCWIQALFFTKLLQTVNQCIWKGQ